MINNLNEIMIFSLIVILIILSYYDIKYSIIFIIICYLFYIYGNKIIYKDNYNDFKNYDDEVNIYLTKLEKYKNIDYDSYRLGLKYYKYFIRNIKIINETFNIHILKSYLENSKIYLDTSIDHFKSILFSIDIDDTLYNNELSNIINNLDKHGNDLIKETEYQYHKVINCNTTNNEKSNIFCQKDAYLYRHANIKPKEYDDPIYERGMFDKENIDKKQTKCPIIDSDGMNMGSTYIPDPHLLIPNDMISTGTI